MDRQACDTRIRIDCSVSTLIKYALRSWTYTCQPYATKIARTVRKRVAAAAQSHMALRSSRAGLVSWLQL